MENKDNTVIDLLEIFNNIDDMITVHDGDFNIILANKAAQEKLGLPSLDNVKAKCFRYFHGKDHPPDGCPSCKCIITGVTAKFEMFEPHLNMPISIKAIPRFNDNGQFIGMIHIVKELPGEKSVA
jgi:PAS domain-containing protein